MGKYQTFLDMEVEDLMAKYDAMEDGEVNSGDVNSGDVNSGDGGEYSFSDGKPGDGGRDSHDLDETIDEWMDAHGSGQPAPVQAVLREFLQMLLRKAPKELTGELILAFKNYPTLWEHYNRNRLMPEDKMPKSPAEAARMGWNDGVSASCHQFHTRNGRNEKWVSPDGHLEVIFDARGQVVTTPEDMGTYNFMDPQTKWAGHMVMDVLPWLMNGNTPEDSTTFLQRATAWRNG